jgi:hypothetical protein
MKLAFFWERLKLTTKLCVKKLMYLTMILKSSSMLSKIDHLIVVDWQTFSRFTQLRLRLRRLKRLNDESRLSSFSADFRFCRCQDYQSYMSSRYSSSNQSFMLSSRSFSMFLQNMSFQNVLISNMSFAFFNSEVSRSFFIKCIYCYEENHLFKRKCVKFNENFKAERIHLQKRRIHFDFYNLDAFHVRMIFYKSQKQCVENVEKLTYSNRVVAIVTKIHIVRLKKTRRLSFLLTRRRKKSFS